MSNKLKVVGMPIDNGGREVITQEEIERKEMREKLSSLGRILDKPKRKRDKK